MRGQKEEKKENEKEEKEEKFLHTGRRTDQSKVVQEVLADLKMGTHLFLLLLHYLHHRLCLRVCKIRMSESFVCLF